MDKKKFECEPVKKVSKSNDGQPRPNQAKPQTFHQKEGKQEATAGLNSEWDNPKQHIDLPCQHFITVYKANKQADINHCTFIECVVCKQKYPISVLESGSETGSYDAVNSFNKNSNRPSSYPETYKYGNEYNSKNDKEKYRQPKGSQCYLENKATRSILSSNVKDKKAIKNEIEYIVNKENGGNSNENSNNVPRKQFSHASKDQSIKPQLTKEIVVKKKIKGGSGIENNAENCCGNQSSNFKEPSKQQSSNSSGFNGLLGAEREPIVDEKSNISLNQSYQNDWPHYSRKNRPSPHNSHRKNSHYDHNSSNNVSRDGGRSKNLSYEVNTHHNFAVPQMASEDHPKSVIKKNYSHSSSQMMVTDSSIHPDVLEAQMGNIDKEKYCRSDTGDQGHNYERNLHQPPNVSQWKQYNTAIIPPNVKGRNKLIRNENDNNENRGNFNNKSSRDNSIPFKNDNNKRRNSGDIPVNHPDVLEPQKASSNSIKNDNETNRNQNEDVDISNKMFLNNSNDNNKRPIPAPRHIKYDGKPVFDSNTNTTGPNSPIDVKENINSPLIEKGAIVKTINRPITNVESSSGVGFKSDSISSELLLQICIDCKKLFPQKICEAHITKGHKVRKINEGINILMNEELKTIKSMQNDIQNKFLDIHRHDTTLNACISILPDVYMAFNKIHSGIHDSQKEKGNQIIYQIQEISGKYVSMDIPPLFMDFENLRRNVEKEKIKADTWHRETNNMIPFWLISSWLKNTIAVMLSGEVSQGKKIFVVKRNVEEEIAKLSFLGNRLFLSPFFKNVTIDDDDFLIKYEHLEPIFDKEASLAFVRISYGDEEPSAPIIIRVNNATFWGKQFLIMCTSESGQSFFGTKFFRNNWLGKEGHHIWGGDYSSNDGNGGNSVLQDKDISLEKSPLPLVDGMIASRYGYEDRSTIFRIYLQGSKSGFTESCAFAQIEEGIDILQCAAMKGDITMLTISDIGIVAELN